MDPGRVRVVSGVARLRCRSPFEAEDSAAGPHVVSQVADVGEVSLTAVLADDRVGAAVEDSREARQIGHPLVRGENRTARDEVDGVARRDAHRARGADDGVQQILLATTDVAAVNAVAGEHAERPEGAGSLLVPHELARRRGVEHRQLRPDDFQQVPGEDAVSAATDGRAPRVDGGRTQLELEVRRAGDDDGVDPELAGAVGALCFFVWDHGTSLSDRWTVVSVAEISRNTRFRQRNMEIWYSSSTQGG